MAFFLMLWRIFNLTTVLVVAVLCVSLSASAQPYRDTLSQSTQEIHKSLLLHAKAQEFDKVKSYVLLIKPLTAVFQQKFGIDIEKELETALNKKDRGEVEKALYHLIYLDIKDLLILAEGKGKETFDIEHAKTTVQAAYLNYLLLSSAVQENHFAADQTIKNKFRKLVLMLVRATPYKKEGLELSVEEKQRREINQGRIEIERELMAALELP